MNFQISTTIFMLLHLSASAEEEEPVWPLPGNLVGFWPFNAESGLNDIANGNNKPMSFISRPKLVSWMDGPFGASNTSYSVSCADCQIGFHYPITLTSSFTVSFYFYSSKTFTKNGQGAIVMIKGTKTLFAVNYLEPDYVEIWGANEGNSYSKIIGRFEVFQMNKWNFVAIVYDQGFLGIYGENGELLKFRYDVHVAADASARLEFGYSDWGTDATSMKMDSSDAIACVMLYNTSLTSDKVAQLPYHCETKGQGSTPRGPVENGTLPTPYPRPASLVALWSFSAQDGTNEIAYKRPSFATGYAKLERWLPGPFHKQDTSYSVTEDGQYIGYTEGVPFGSDFTFALYFHTLGRESDGGLVMFRSRESKKPQLVINYVQKGYFDIWAGDGCKDLINTFKVNGTYGAWNFVAVMYNSTSRKAAAYTIGEEFFNWYPAPMANDTNSTDVFFGYATWERAKIGFMKTTDAISCAMLLDKVLRPEKILWLASTYCETKQPPPTGVTMGTTTTVAPNKPWPRPESLQGFWPLKRAIEDWPVGLRDLGQNEFHGVETAKPKYTNGPYGDYDAAITPRSNNETVILTHNNTKLSLTESFTISFFIAKGDRSTEGGIFQFLERDEPQSKHTLQIRYVDATSFEVSANNATIGTYKVVQQKGAWTFVAFVFSGPKDMLTVYGRHGIVSPASRQPTIRSSLPYSNYGIQIGYTSKWLQGLNDSDAICCLSIYSTALNSAEVLQLVDACRKLHESVVCGSAFDWLDPIPETNKAATIPDRGQFPYIASLRTSDNKTKCTATIIDQYWLLTASSCLDKPLKVYIAEYDINNTRKKHVRGIAEAMRSGDIALIALDEPVDFKYDYILDTCLFDDESADLTSPQFVVGWGKNGRNDNDPASSGLPRYMHGHFQMDNICSSSWGGKYVSGKDVCFLSSVEKEVPCDGDEGSPLLAQSKDRNRLIQIGIYIARDSKCSPEPLPLFNKIAYLRRWIQETIACAVPGISYYPKCPQD